MPVVGRGDRNGIDLRIVEQIAKVAIRSDGLVAFLELFDLVAQVIGVAVAEGRDAYAGDISEIPDIAPAFAADFDERADPDLSEPDIVVCPNTRDELSERVAAAAIPLLKNVRRFIAMVST